MKQRLSEKRLKKAIDDYFTQRLGEWVTLSERGKERTVRRPLTLAGLLVDLSLTDAQWQEMLEDPKRAPICYRALKRLESETLERTLTGEYPASAGQLVLASDFGYSKKEAEPGAVRIALPPDLEEQCR